MAVTGANVSAHVSAVNYAEMVKCVETIRTTYGQRWNSFNCRVLMMWINLMSLQVYNETLLCFVEIPNCFIIQFWIP